MIHRMRTIQEAMQEIRGIDAQSAITKNCIRMLCKSNQVRCIYTGKKILVDMDKLLERINGDNECCEVAANEDDQEAIVPASLRDPSS